MEFGIALIEKEGNSGLLITEIQLLYDIISSEWKNEEVFPIEFLAKANECSAIGLISRKTAEALEFDYENSGLYDFIASVLDSEKSQEIKPHYKFKDINIWLRR